MLKGQKEPQRIEAERIDELASKGYFKNRGTAIDGGAHVGSMTLKLAQYFDTVWAFEPCDEAYDYLLENTQHDHRIMPMPMALMDKRCTVNVHPPRPKIRTLTARRCDYGGDTQATTIDLLNLTDCNFIKLDLEGCELLALRGAEETIRKFKPVLMIEFNDNELGRRFGYMNDDVIQFLKKHGYRQAYRNGVDRVFVYD